MKFLIAGAGAIGGYIGAAWRGRARTLRSSRAVRICGPCRSAACAFISADGDFEVHPTRHRRASTGAGPFDVIFLGVKAHGLTQLAPQLKPLIGENTTVVSTQNGVPWWYFQSDAGEFAGLHLERVDPGGVIAAPSIPAQRGRLHRLSRHRNRRARA